MAPVNLEQMFSHLSVETQMEVLTKAEADFDRLPEEAVVEACKALGVETANKKQAAAVLAGIREAAPVLVKLGLLAMA